MASSENGIIGDDLRERGDPTGTAGTLTDMEAELKRKKFRAKSTFTRIKKSIVFDRSAGKARLSRDSGGMQ